MKKSKIEIRNSKGLAREGRWSNMMQLLRAH